MKTRVVNEPGGGHRVATVRTRCACGAWNSFEADEDLPGILCGACKQPIPVTIPEGALGGEALERCCRCGAAAADDLWLRKDFNPTLGLGIVLVAVGASLVTFTIWPLIVATVFDVGLYWWLPWVSTCYHCRTEHRGLPKNPAHGAFDLARQEDLDADKAAAERRTQGVPEPDDGPVL